VLVKLEKQGFNTVPCAMATKLTMDRQGIRKLVAEQLDLPTSKFKFASTKKEYLDSVKKINLPFLIKPVMSSSGKGQSIVKTNNDTHNAWDYAHSASRRNIKSVIV
jgi:phosphoribosylglycinamide formyltransferase 2